MPRVISITHLPQITQVLQKNRQCVIALDLETTGLHPRMDKIVTLQFGTLSRVFILDCRPYYDLDKAEQDMWKEAIQGLIQACPCIVGHNLKFDYKFLSHHFGAAMDRVVDTMLQELVIYGVGMGHAEDYGIAVTMHDTASRYGLQVTKEQRSWFIGLDTRMEWYAELPQEQLMYCVQDVTIPLLIYERQQPILEEKGLTHIAELENLCLPAIARMELDGCYVDRERWKAIIDRKKTQRSHLETELQIALDAAIQEHRQRVYAEQKACYDLWVAAKAKAEQALKAEFEQGLTGCTWGEFKRKGMKAFKETNPCPGVPKLDTTPINLGSHMQLKQALETRGIFVESTDKEHLSPYAKQDPVVAKILEWKALDKFINAFGESLLDKIEDDGRIHPTYNQIGAATGRMSCQSPNWQQLPSHEPEETSVRRCVVAEQGNKLLVADFSNIELRILADITGDKNMLQLFAEGKDLHSMTARMMFCLPEEVNPKIAELKPGLSYRAVAKTINFGLVYGMSPVKLGRTLGIPKEDAEALFHRYFEAYPGVALWLKTAPAEALTCGYSSTVGGRKRFYDVPPEPTFDARYMSYEDYAIRKRDYMTRIGMYERQAKNAPIQGTNADITKYALALLYRHLPPHAKLVACVHDEIVLEAPEDRAEQIAQLLSRCMYKACKRYLTKVVIPPVDVHIGDYWKKE